MATSTGISTVALGALLAAARPAAAGEQPLTLESAIQLALDRNLRLARSALSLQSGAQDVLGARADFAPRIIPDSRVGFSSAIDDYAYGAGLGRKFTSGADVTVGGQISASEDDDEDTTLQRGRVRAELRQPLLRNFGPLVQTEPILLANSRLRRSQRDLEQQKADLVVEVVTVYEDILRYEGQERADQLSYERVDRLHRLTQAREAQGRASRVDSLRVDLDRGKALSRLESDRDALFSLRQDLAEVLGATADTTFALAPPPEVEVPTPDLAEAVLVALSNRLDYAQSLDDTRDARRSLRIARRRVMPDLSLLGRYERRGEGEDSSDAWALDEDDWFLGLGLSSAVNPAEDRVAIARAEVDYEAARRGIGIAEASIVRSVQQQVSAHRRARSELQIARRNTTLAASRAKLARRLFETGRGDNFSVTDAEDALVAAQNQQLAAVAEAQVSAYRLFRELGTVLEYPPELKPPAIRLDP